MIMIIGIYFSWFGAKIDINILLLMLNFRPPYFCETCSSYVILVILYYATQSTLNRKIHANLFQKRRWGSHVVYMFSSIVENILFSIKFLELIKLCLSYN